MHGLTHQSVPLRGFILDSMPYALQKESREGKDPEVAKAQVSSSTKGGPPADVHITVDKQANGITVVIRECKAVAGRDGQADLTPVFESLKGCPTGLVTLLSPAEGGLAAYTWSQPSLATDIPNLLVYGSGETGKDKDKGKKEEVGKGAARWSVGHYRRTQSAILHETTYRSPRRGSRPSPRRP